jgi:hypothetical protein
MVPLLVGVAAAAGLTLVAFMRPRGAFRPTPFPSLQHVVGSTPRRRRTFTFEDLVGLVLRLGALVAVAVGLVAAARGGRVLPVVLVDPATGEAGRSVAREIEASARLGFEHGQAWAEGPLGAWLAPSVHACSANVERCLARVAAQTGRPVVAVGERAHGWDGLDDVTQPVSWREAHRATTAAPPADAGVPLRASVHQRGDSTEVALWAAALVVAAGSRAVHVDVVDATWSGEDDGAPRLVVETTVTAARAGWPAVVRASAEGVTFNDVAACVTEREALALRSSLAWADGSSLAGRVVIARAEGARPMVGAAATAEDLGRWAHEGSLLTLAHAVLGALTEGPARCVGVPPQVARANFDEPLGVFDVAPGTYRRADGRVEVEVLRGGEGAAQPWANDGTFETRGSALPAGAFASAAVLVMVALWRSRRWSLLPGFGAVLLLVLFALDVERETARSAAPVIRVDASAAGALLGVDAGVRLVPVDEVLACERPRASTPCEVFATVGAAWAPPSRADWLLFDERAPRVDVLAVEAPGQVPLGSAARLEVTVRVRRSRGRSVRVRAQPEHGAPVEKTRLVSRDDEVLQVAVEVAALIEADDHVLIDATVLGEGASIAQAVDAREVTVAFVHQGRRRVVLAGAPSWEARFATRALRAQGGGETASLTRVGASAVQAVGLARVDPLRWLTGSTHEQVDTIVLTGFARRELEGAVGQALKAFVQRGGALLFLGGEGVEALGWPSVAPGEGPLSARVGDLLDGSERLEVLAVGKAGPLPRGAQVLATVGEAQPLMLGRAEGAGRVAAVVGAELFRLGPPGGEGSAAERALFRAVGWVEASPRSAAPMSDPSNTQGARARLRGEARRRGVPFFEPDGVGELERGLARRPATATRAYPVSLREDLPVVAALLALLVLEAFSRGRRRSGAAVVDGPTRHAESAQRA